MPVRSVGDLAVEASSTALRNLALVATKLLDDGPTRNTGLAAHPPAAPRTDRQTVTADLWR